MPAINEIPDDFLSGGANLTPNGSGEPSLTSILQQMRASLPQIGVGTLVAGTFTVEDTIVLTANSRILVSFATRPTTTTNLAGLAVTARTNGALGVAEFTVEALVAAGTIDSDAVGTVTWAIFD